MALSIETVNKALAQVRGYAQYGMGLATMLGVMTAAQQKGALDAFSDIGAGLAQVIHGATNLWTIGVVVAGPFISFALAQWSKARSTTESHAAEVQAAVKDPNSPISFEAKKSILDATANLAEVKPHDIPVSDPVLARAVDAPNVVPARP